MTMTWQMFSARGVGRAMVRMFLVSALGGLAACSSADPEYKYPEQIGGSDQHDPLGRSTNTDAEVGRLTGPGGLLDFGGSGNKEGAGIAVNRYLWRATLDTLSFMPLANADPFGGVIITDWYSNPNSPRERFKVTAYILDKKLRADGIKVSVFRQYRSDEGIWVDQTASEEAQVQIENAILTRARQLRVADLDRE